MTSSSQIIRPVAPPEDFPVISRTLPRAERRAGQVARRGGFWQSVLDRIVPFGYEDETGFHYGKQPPRLSDQI